MSVSVIIPVYNAEKYIKQAVESAIAQKETGEIILVDDGYGEQMLNICKELEHQYEKVILLQHPDKKNHGAGASRNVGIKAAQFDYIAFLDADDFYLPNRFTETLKIFHAFPDIEAVYGTTDSHFETEALKNKYGPELITTIKNPPAPSKLFWHMEPIGKNGYFTTDAITIRKSAFSKIGLFENLEVNQDINLWLKLAMACKLSPTTLHKAIARRRVHEENRSRNKTKYLINLPLSYKNLVMWGIKKKISIDKLSILSFWFLLCRAKYFLALPEKNILKTAIKELPFYCIVCPIVILMFPFIIYFQYYKRKRQ